MAEIDWRRLVDIIPKVAPLFVAATGRLPEAGAMMQGYVRGQQQFEAVDRQRQLDLANEAYRQMQLRFQQEASERATEQLALTRRGEAREALQAGLGPLLGPEAQLVPDFGEDLPSLQAAVDRLVKSLSDEYQIPQTFAQTLAPPIGPLVSQAKRRRAKAFLEQQEKRYGEQWSALKSTFRIAGGEFAGLTPQDIEDRYVLGVGQLVDSGGSPIEPLALKLSDVDRAQFLRTQMRRARDRGDELAEREYERQYQDLVQSVKEIAAARPPVPILYAGAAQGPVVIDPRSGIAREVVDRAGQPLPRPPTAEQLNRQDALKQIVPIFRTMKSLGEQVIAGTGPAQRATALARGVGAMVGLDPIFRTYQDFRGSFASMIAVATQGSRPSDVDVLRTALPIIPNPYSDDRRSAALKWWMIFTRFKQALSPEMQEQLGLPADTELDFILQQAGISKPEALSRRERLMPLPASRPDNVPVTPPAAPVGPTVSGPTTPEELEEVQRRSRERERLRQRQRLEDELKRRGVQ